MVDSDSHFAEPSIGRSTGYVVVVSLAGIAVGMTLSALGVDTSVAAAATGFVSATASIFFVLRPKKRISPFRRLLLASAVGFAGATTFLACEFFSAR